MELNKQIIAEFEEQIEDGMPFTYTCDLLEISWNTFNNWMKQGESDVNNEINSLQAKFFKSIKKAYAKFIKATKNRIYNGESGWQGSAWWLERTNKQFILTNDAGDVIEPVIVKPSVSKK